MACGVLPGVDKQLCAFERWLGIHLATVTDSGHAQVLRRFATWEVLPRLRARAEKNPLSTGSRGYAVGQVLRATEFLQWLSERELALSGCRQADIDAWHAGRSENHRSAVWPFLQWCMANKLTGRFRLPQAVTGHSAPMPEPERIKHLGRVLADGALPLRTLAAAAIVLLYAQSASRVVRLILDDVAHGDGEVFLRLGDPPSPVPSPVAGILLSWIGSRQHEDRDEPQLAMAVPGPPDWPAHARRLPRQAAQRDRHPHGSRADLGDPPARPGDASTRRGRRPQLQPGHHRQARRPGRRHLQPLRPR
jgi:hypothetical protein